MSHVSKIKISEKISGDMGKNFTSFITRATNSKTVKIFLDEIFTPTEKIMFAKRLAVVTMLLRGFGYVQIRKTLKVSPTTVSYFQHACESGSFSYIQSVLGKKKEGGQFLKALEKALSFRLPPKTGRGRWDFLNK